MDIIPDNQKNSAKHWKSVCFSLQPERAPALIKVQVYAQPDFLPSQIFREGLIVLESGDATIDTKKTTLFLKLRRQNLVKTDLKV